MWRKQSSKIMSRILTSPHPLSGESRIRAIRFYFRGDTQKRQAVIKGKMLKSFKPVLQPAFLLP